MGLDKLLAKINKEDEILREDILERANKQCLDIQDIFKNEVEVYSNLEWIKVKRHVEFLKQKSEVEIDLKRRKNILAAKRSILEDVYSLFKEDIKIVPVDVYKNWLLDNIRKADFLNKKGLLYVGIGIYTKIDESFLALINDILNNHKIEIKLTKDIDFGFKYIEDAIMLDSTLDALIGELRKNEELALASILFDTASIES